MKQISTAFSSSDLGAGSIAGETCRYFFGCPPTSPGIGIRPYRREHTRGPGRVGRSIEPMECGFGGLRDLLVVRGSLPRKEVLESLESRVPEEFFDAAKSAMR